MYVFSIYQKKLGKSIIVKIQLLVLITASDIFLWQHSVCILPFNHLFFTHSKKYVKIMCVMLSQTDQSNLNLSGNLPVNWLYGISTF